MVEVKFRTQIGMDVPPTADNHVTTKKWVEDKIQGLRWDPVAAAATSNLPGTATGMTLTGSTNGAFPTIDGVTITVGDRVLLPSQSDKSQNGIYELSVDGDASNPWELTRTADADANSEFRPNKSVYVSPGGTKFGGVSFKQTTGTAVVLGTSAIEFALDQDTNKVLSETVTFTGDGSTSEFTLTHSLNTKNVRVDIYDASYALTFFEVQPTSKTTVKVAAALPLANGETFKAVIMGMPE